jgi:hypothetical protein
MKTEPRTDAHCVVINIGGLWSAPFRGLGIIEACLFAGNVMGLYLLGLSFWAA